jgi:Zn ribbon nucleic-acid-binding protein
MSVTMMIFIGLSFAIIFLFFYIFVSSKSVDRKFQRIGLALEDMNEEIFQLQKEQKRISQNLVVDVDKIVSEKVDDIVKTLLKSIKESQFKSENEIRSLYDKIEKLENNIKINSLPNLQHLDSIATKKDDNSKIKELFEIGYSVEEIAKEVNMSVGEVNKE